MSSSYARRCRRLAGRGTTDRGLDDHDPLVSELTDAIVESLESRTGVDLDVDLDDVFARELGRMMASPSVRVVEVDVEPGMASAIELVF